MPVSLKAISPFYWLPSDVPYNLNIPLVDDVTVAHIQS